ncbi:ATP-binding protein [Paenibacillus allorhizosphaerae]|uniref:Adaptive-response sensory-kinase SasA n=1 Tax=Paenibacillus allorhizosphaerae TaxID=2849866 RepID=A0ABM8V9S5_9BACL|nr:ATP-binding protein [Paenibacillus allorhizosphaerae]CAG7614197.1 Adaptive-response sensory-kinase SasA [Paenibacillus allorhizosphaerae]
MLDILKQYFVQFGIIFFPISVYQLWTIGKSFNQLPIRGWLMGVYGGGSAILCQLMPVHIMGQTENFQCVPVILSILYGKRKAGIVSIGLLTAFQLLTMKQDVAFSIAGILVYSAIPLLFCNRFEKFERRKRFIVALLLSVVTIIVELLFLFVCFSIRFGHAGLLIQYYGFLGIACVIQLTMMVLAFFLIENTIEIGRIRNRQESLIEYNPLGICAFDLNNRFIKANAAYEKITGYKESELLGQSRLQMWFDDGHDYAGKIMAHVSQGEILKDMEATLRHKHGDKIAVRFTVVPIVEGDHIVGVFGMINDITESKRSQEHLRNSEKLSVIGQLAAGVAHEIRNPLTTLKGFLQILSKSETTAKKDQEYFEIMKDELTRIESIVSEMLVLAKPQALSVQSVDLKETLEHVIKLLSAQANMQNIEITFFDNQLTPTVMGDENQLKQVFLNVVKNAFEAMPQGGILCIGLGLHQGHVQIDFIDTGVGIPEDIVQKIGEPFFTTKSKGTGLGFLLSKRIITNHNGSMHIQSTVGKGTMVSVHLPVSE